MRIDRSRIGLYGSSNGGWVAPIAAVESNKSFPSGRILDPGPYFNLLAGRQYFWLKSCHSHGDYRLPVTGHNAVTLNKANLNLCASRAA